MRMTPLIGKGLARVASGISILELPGGPRATHALDRSGNGGTWCSRFARPPVRLPAARHIPLQWNGSRGCPGRKFYGSARRVGENRLPAIPANSDVLHVRCNSPNFNGSVKGRTSISLLLRQTTLVVEVVPWVQRIAGK